jgi:hypothetical protein
MSHKTLFGITNRLLKRGRTQFVMDLIFKHGLHPRHIKQIMDKVDSRECTKEQILNELYNEGDYQAITK